jgi:hypothetical protein
MDDHTRIMTFDSFVSSEQRRALRFAQGRATQEELEAVCGLGETVHLDAYPEAMQIQISAYQAQRRAS